MKCDRCGRSLRDGQRYECCVNCGKSWCEDLHPCPFCGCNFMQILVYPKVPGNQPEGFREVATTLLHDLSNVASLPPQKREQAQAAITGKTRRTIKTSRKETCRILATDGFGGVIARAIRAGDRVRVSNLEEARDNLKLDRLSTEQLVAVAYLVKQIDEKERPCRP